MAFGQKCDAKVPKKNLSSLAWFSGILHTFSLTACLITARVRKDVAKRQTGFPSHECRSCQSGFPDVKKVECLHPLPKEAHG